MNTQVASQNIYTPLPSALFSHLVICILNMHSIECVVLCLLSTCCNNILWSTAGFYCLTVKFSKNVYENANKPSLAAISLVGELTKVQKDNHNASKPALNNSFFANSCCVKTVKYIPLCHRWISRGLQQASEGLELFSPLPSPFKFYKSN